MIDCLVTIHGVGTQTEGYANNLHDHLRAVMGDKLFADPIYVTGHWPPHDIELGRLGRWDSASHRSIDIHDAPLGTDGTIVHIPLVYADIEGTQSHPLELIEVLVQAILALANVNAIRDVERMGEDLLVAALDDVKAAGEVAQHAVETRVGSAPERLKHAAGFNSQVRVAAPQAVTLGPATAQTTEAITTTVQLTPAQSALLAKLDPGNLLTPLENDVAMYVVRNDHRERVRSFVHDAILRLCYRSDVCSVVINAHSNGTVIGTDIMRQLPPGATSQIKAFVTSGSPLRKYNDCFNWGHDFFLSSSTGTPIPQVQRWTNFWDRHDPVADPLDSLFAAWDPQSGTSTPVKIDDVLVDNLAHSSGGGLQAHNYWDNTVEWIPKFVQILRG